jgi:hypothetical protein
MLPEDVIDAEDPLNSFKLNLFNVLILRKYSFFCNCGKFYVWFSDNFVFELDSLIESNTWCQIETVKICKIAGILVHKKSMKNNFNLGLELDFFKLQKIGQNFNVPNQGKY